MKKLIYLNELLSDSLFTNKLTNTMSRMFEQLKREKMNQATRKIQTTKFELNRLKNEQSEMEKNITLLTEELLQYEEERELLLNGSKDIDIRMEIGFVLDSRNNWISDLSLN